MCSIKELSLSEVELVSGGNANGNYERGSSSSHGAPATSANNAGIGIIAGTLGALAAMGTGPIGMVIAGAAVGGLGSAMPSTSSTPSSSNNGRSDGSWHDTNPGGLAGECRW